MPNEQTVQEYLLVLECGHTHPGSAVVVKEDGTPFKPNWKDYWIAATCCDGPHRVISWRAVGPGTKL